MTTVLEKFMENLEQTRIPEMGKKLTTAYLEHMDVTEEVAVSTTSKLKEGAGVYKVTLTIEKLESMEAVE